MLKRSCQQVVQLSVHPHWSVGALLTARKERHREGAREAKRKMLWIFLSVRRSDSLAGDAKGGRSMQDKRIPTVHCSGAANHLPKTDGSSKLPFMITILVIIPTMMMMTCRCLCLGLWWCVRVEGLCVRTSVNTSPCEWDAVEVKVAEPLMGWIKRSNELRINTV